MIKFNEMIYKNKRTYEILAIGSFNKYPYKIVSLGTHPCAYVRLPYDNIYYNIGYDSIPIDAHGGLTFSGKFEDKSDEYWIGWDYAHCGDYTDFCSSKDEKKWTVSEIYEDIKSVIDQLKHIEDILNTNEYKRKVENYKYSLIETILETEREIEEKNGRSNRSN